MRLEPSMWDALASICDREGKSIHRLATEIDERRGKTAMTSAVRVFVFAYYQRLAETMEQRLSGQHSHQSVRPLRAEGPDGAGPVLDEVFGAR